MAGKLRYFLYRFDPIVSQFLEKLEGGACDEESIRRSCNSGTGLSAGVGVGPVTGSPRPGDPYRFGLDPP